MILRMRFADFTRATRSQTLAQTTAATRTVLAAVRELIAASAPKIERRGLTLLGITVSNLDARGAGRQLELPLDGRSLDALDEVLDQLRQRIGPTVVTRATLLNRRVALAQWLFPTTPKTRALAGEDADEPGEALLEVVAAQRDQTLGARAVVRVMPASRSNRRWYEQVEVGSPSPSRSRRRAGAALSASRRTISSRTGSPSVRMIVARSSAPTAG